MKKKPKDYDDIRWRIVDQCFNVFEAWSSSSDNDHEDQLEFELKILFKLIRDYDEKRYFETFQRAINHIDKDYETDS